MSRRTAEESRRIRLMKLCEANNALSPDIHTALLTADTQMEAYIMVGHWMDISNMEVPFEDWGLTIDTWVKSLKPPVELYFLFKRKKDVGRFVRKMSREFPEKEIIV